MPDSDNHYDIYVDFEFLELPICAIAGWHHIPSGPYWVLGSKNGVDRFYKRGHLSSAVETFCREFLPLRSDVMCYIMDSSGDVILGAIFNDEHEEQGFGEWHGCQMAFDELEKVPFVEPAAVVYWRLMAQGALCDD